MLKGSIILFCKAFVLCFSPEIGNGWRPTVINEFPEWMFLIAGQKSFCNSASYWIGGSTDSEVNSTFLFGREYGRHNRGIYFIGDF